MRILFACLALAAISLLPGCGEPAADVAKPQSYNQKGLAFQYPGNWTIEDDTTENSFRNVTIETTGDALVIVQFFPLAIASALADYSQEFSTDFAAAIPFGKASPPVFTKLDPKDGYTRLKETFSMQILGQDIPHVRIYHSRDVGSHRCFILCQVADEDFHRVEAGFDQVVRSMKVSDER